MAISIQQDTGQGEGKGGEGRGGCEQTEEHKAFEEVGGGGEKAVWCGRVLSPSEIRNKQSP